MDYIVNVSGGLLSYDGRIFEYDDDARSAALVGLLTKSTKLDTIFSALHLTDSTKDPKFSFFSKIVADDYLSDGMVSYANFF